MERSKSSILSSSYLDNLITAVKEIDPNIRIPDVGKEETGRQVFLARLCVALVRRLEEERDRTEEVACWQRTLGAKEEDLEEVARRLVEEREDLEREKVNVERERKEVQVIRKEWEADREALLNHTKSLEQHSSELAAYISTQQTEAQILEAKRSRLLAKLQRTLKLQKAFKLQLRDFEVEKQARESALAQLQRSIEEKQTCLAQIHRDTPHFVLSKATSDSIKTLSITSLQTQTEMLDDPGSALSDRIVRLERLGEELSQAKERLDMDRSDMESQVENLRDRLRISQTEKSGLAFTVSQLQGELAGVKSALNRTLERQQSLEDIAAREELLSRQESELAAGLESAAHEESLLFRKREELESLEDRLKAAQDGLRALQQENAQGLTTAHDQLTGQRKEIEKAQAQLTWTQADIEHTAAEIAAQIQAAQQSFLLQETALTADKAEIRELMDLLEKEGKQLAEKEAQLRALARQLTARELHLYTREKEVRRREHCLPEHQAAAQALDFRMPLEDKAAFDQEDLLSCSLSPSPPEPQSLERIPI